jgi:hypothetical protein
VVSVTQRITQYNSEMGQPRGGLVNPRAMTVTSLDDGLGIIDAKLENLHASIVGSAVDYLVRLARLRTAAADFEYDVMDVFRVSLRGAERIVDHTRHASVGTDALEAVRLIATVPQDDGRVAALIDADAVRAACRLASYDVGTRNDPALYDPATARVPDAPTIAHVLAMVERSLAFFAEYGPVTKDGFVFADPATATFLNPYGDRSGYTDLVTSGDGDFLTADTLWDFKVTSSKPTKDHTLQVLMYFFMGKASALPEFETQTHVGLFNPRLGTIHRLAVADVPEDVIDTIRYHVIGCER